MSIAERYSKVLGTLQYGYRERLKVSRKLQEIHGNVLPKRLEILERSNTKTLKKTPLLQNVSITKLNVSKTFREYFLLAGLYLKSSINTVGPECCNCYSC